MGHHVLQAMTGIPWIVSLSADFDCIFLVLYSLPQ